MNSTIPHGSFSRRGGRTSLLMATVLLALSLGLAGTALSQDQQAAPPPPQNGQQSGQETGRHMGRRSMPSVDDQVKHLSKKLNLSSDQQAKLKPILEDQRTQMDAIHNDSSLSREDRFSKMQSLRESSDGQIKSLLNDDQQKNFDKMREEQKSRMGKWHKGGDNAPATPPAGGGTPQ